MEDSKTQHTTFDTMGLKEPLLRGIFAYGFERPSAIQTKAIVPMCTGNDIIVKKDEGCKGCK